jgi:arylsulfatase A-like enzyme
MTMFRDPVAGKSFGGALSSDFEEDELPYKPWRRRCSEESSRVESLEHRSPPIAAVESLTRSDDISQPNVLLFVADDMGYGDFGVFNDGSAHTPNLDALVDEGLCLSQHYAGAPACSPSRAALLTGRYPHRTGALTPMEMRGMDRIALDELTLGDAFQHAGYRTGMIGKWHNGALDPRYHPNARGFDEFYGFCGGWMDYFDWNVNRNGSAEFADGRYLTDTFTDEAVGFLRRHSSESFLLCVTYNAPHSPLQAPVARSQPYMEAGLTPGAAITYAMNEVMDDGVGRILSELEALGLSENTIVMFTSDNGPAFSLRPDQVAEGMSTDCRRFNCGLNGQKGSVYEGGIRVPMVIRWPDGLDHGIFSDPQVHFTDWLPTLLAATGINEQVGRPLDGRDVLPELRGEVAKKAPPRFWQLNQYQPVGWINAAMRDGPWKLVRPHQPMPPATDEDRRRIERYVEADIEYKRHPERVTELMSDPDPELVIPPPAATELYNVEEDPLEENNLAQQEAPRTARMLVELENWFEEVEAERQRIQPDGSIIE